jgi:hypothetical protein
MFWRYGLFHCQIREINVLALLTVLFLHYSSVTPPTHDLVSKYDSNMETRANTVELLINFTGCRHMA